MSSRNRLLISSSSQLSGQVLHAVEENDLHMESLTATATAEEKR